MTDNLNSNKNSNNSKNNSNNHKDLAVVGDSNFTLGFRLAGVQRIVTTESPKADLLKLLQDNSIGIIIVEEKLVTALDDGTQEELFESIDPVVLQLAETVNQDALRKMVQQSIGVDVLKDED